MHKKRVLHIEISTLRESLAQFADVWWRAERGEEIEPYEGAGFESMASLLRTLTPKRWELIELLKKEGALTIYRLAKQLGRDYKNVHGDVKALETMGIIERRGSKVSVPWDEIATRLRLAA
jgi:predicted transcriptional regulator